MTAHPLPRLIISEGPAISWTNYWGSDRANAGCPCVSYDQGTLQILLPPASEHVLDQWPPIGTHAELWEDVDEGRPVVRLLWFEEPLRPHQVLVAEEDWFGYFPSVDMGRVVPLVWYTQVGEGGVAERRRELIQLGRAS